MCSYKIINKTYYSRFLCRNFHLIGDLNILSKFLCFYFHGNDGGKAVICNLIFANYCLITSHRQVVVYFLLLSVHSPTHYTYLFLSLSITFHSIHLYLPARSFLPKHVYKCKHVTLSEISGIEVCDSNATTQSCGGMSSFALFLSEMDVYIKQWLRRISFCVSYRIIHIHVQLLTIFFRFFFSMDTTSMNIDIPKEVSAVDAGGSSNAQVFPGFMEPPRRVDLASFFASQAGSGNPLDGPVLPLTGQTNPTTFAAPPTSTPAASPAAQGADLGNTGEPKKLSKWQRKRRNIKLKKQSAGQNAGTSSSGSSTGVAVPAQGMASSGPSGSQTKHLVLRPKDRVAPPEQRGGSSDQKGSKRQKPDLSSSDPLGGQQPPKRPAAAGKGFKKDQVPSSRALRLVITKDPATERFTEEQRLAVVDHINGVFIADTRSISSETWTFCGLNDHEIKYDCSTQEAFRWLEETVAGIPELWSDMKLQTSSLADRPKLTNIGAFFPGPKPGGAAAPLKKEDLRLCFGILERFNGCISTAQWRVYDCRLSTNRRGICARLGIDRLSLELLRDLNFRPRYGTYLAEFYSEKDSRGGTGN